MMSNCTYTVNWSKRIHYKENNENDIPSEYGVYEIQGVNSGDFTRRYVGRTDNLRRRYGEHLSDSEKNKDLLKYLREKKVYFRFTITKNEQMCKDVEKGLYDKHHHTFNDPDNPPAGSGKCNKVDITENEQ